MDNKNSTTIWGRRSINDGKLSLSTNQNDSSNGSRDYFTSRRNGGNASTSRSNPFASATTPGGTLTSPTGGSASSAFGLGMGAFASFGAGSKTPKTPGNPFELALTGKPQSAKKSSREDLKSDTGRSGRTASPASSAAHKDTANSHPLLESWTFWTRPPISKANGYIEYEKTLHAMAKVKTAEEFWTVYKHLKPPSTLPFVTDYHLFKDGVRPVWEDDENKRGGKWILRLKKGIADRYWEDILMACVGGQLDDGSDVVNGAVLSVRNGEDIISIWTSTTGQKVLKIRDSMKLVLKCPPNTRFEFRTHDESIQQRATIEEQRREKAAANHHGERDAVKRASRNNNDSKVPRQSLDEQQRS